MPSGNSAIAPAAAGVLVDRYRDRAVSLLRDLVRIPSVNHPPGGDERAVQLFYADVLRSFGAETETFEPDDVPSFVSHPARLKTHEMSNRPVVAGVLRGAGGGRRLMLIAHADVESPGESHLWADGDPFSGRIENGRIYGRGAGDDKSGMMINAMALRIIRESGIRLKGDLIVSSVPDEEQAGANGSLALLCKGYRADAAIFVDGVNQDLCLSGLGGGNCTVEIRVPGPVANASALLRYMDACRDRIEALRRERAMEVSRHPHYGTPDFGEKVTINLTNIRLGVDDNTHGLFTVWFYLLPGEEPADLQRRFEAALAGIEEPGSRRIEWMPRFLLPSEVPANEPFVGCLSAAFREATGRVGALTGSMMSDMGIVNRYGGYPCLVFGPLRWGREGSPHQPDEFVEVDEVMECLKTVVLCILDWCGCE